MLSANRSLTRFQIIFLTLIVPITMIVFLEITARILNLSQLFVNNKAALEMPTWLLAEHNTRERATSLIAERDKIDWFDIFTEGDGFRVHMVPNISQLVTNTFSLIPSERAKKYKVSSNSLGFRGVDLPSAKAANEFRIAIFGDSSSFGWGVNDTETYAEVLKNNLSALLNRPVTVGNFSVPGDSSEYGRLVFDKFFKTTQADYLILGFGANDAKMVSMPHAKQVARFKSQGIAQKIRKTVLTFEIPKLINNLLSIQISKNTKEKKQYKHAVSPKRYRTNLEYMLTEAKRFGLQEASVIALCTPGAYAKLGKTAATAMNFSFFNGQSYLISKIPELKGDSVLTQERESIETPVNDLPLSDLFYISSDGCHPNTIGHKLIGEQLARDISKNIH